MDGFLIYGIMDKNKQIQIGGEMSLNGKNNDVVMTLPRLFHFDLEDWQTAILSAKRWDWTRRTSLYNLYESCLLDTHLDGTINQRRVAIGQHPIEFVRNGEPDEAINEQIKAPWFCDFAKSIIDSELFGFACYQFYMEDKWIKFTKIDQRHVEPHRKELLKRVGDITGEPLENFPGILFLGEEDNIGRLCRAVPWVLYKRQTVADWVQFSQIFGMPIRDYTYDSGDEESRERLLMEAMQQGSNAVFVHPKDNGLNFIDSGSKSGSCEVYKTLRDTCNEEISLLILGNTLTTNSAAHGTQALGTVHKEEQDTINAQDLRYLLNVLNYDMTEIFSELGLNTDGGEFVLKKDAAQLMGSDVYAQLSAVTQLMANGLPVSDEYLYKTFGIDKPEEYDALKKDFAEKQAAILEQQNQFQRNVSDFYRLGFFGNARLPKLPMESGDGSSDW